MIKPPALQTGDKVVIIAPARKISLTDISLGVDTLKNWSLKVTFSEHLFDDCDQFAGDDNVRAEDLQKAINDKDVKAIFCARGGYGTVRIIDKIDFSPLVDYPKWIIGFSDITVLHSKLHTLGICSLHADVLTTFGDTKDSNMLYLKQILFDEKTEFHHKKLEQTNDNGNRYKIEGEIIGGNISILYSLLGSDCDINTAGKILFLEDLDEYLYHIDRMMICLKRAKKLDNLKALIIGDVSQMNDNKIPFGKTAKEIIAETVSGYDYPVYYDFPAGHIKNNTPIIFGVPATMEISPNEINIKYKNPEVESSGKKYLRLLMYTVIFFLAIWGIFKLCALLLAKYL